MFVRRAIDHYLKGKRSRRDVTRFLETHPDLDRLAERIADEIREGRYRDTRITYFNRVEPISGKHRVIGRESVRHQIYDHVAVMALQPLFDAKVGRWQTASIPNRGTIDARRAIKRWTRERSSKWFVKLDVRKYYPSIDRPTLKAMLTRDVGDPILLRLLRIPAQQRQHPISATPPHRPHHAPRNPVFIHPTQEGKPMLQTVSSLEPLEEVSYYPRGDGLADIRIRRNITTVMHGDGETAWTEYTADEAYTIRDLTEQEAIEQADSIWLDCVQASKSDSQRLAGLEASSLDQDEALAEIYQLLSGGEA